MEKTWLLAHLCIQQVQLSSVPHCRMDFSKSEFPLDKASDSPPEGPRVATHLMETLAAACSLNMLSQTRCSVGLKEDTEGCVKVASCSSNMSCRFRAASCLGYSFEAGPSGLDCPVSHIHVFLGRGA